VNERIVPHATIAHEPAAELLDGPQVVVAGLSAQAACTKFGQELLQATG